MVNVFLARADPHPVVVRTGRVRAISGRQARQLVLQPLHRGLSPQGGEQEGEQTRDDQPEPVVGVRVKMMVQCAMHTRISAVQYTT